jgi:very-short-patch-repair endonuclease
MKKTNYSGMHYGATPQIFNNARILRYRETQEEKILWEYLKGKPQGVKFIRQHPCGIYILDFYCHILKLSIEIDGGYHLKKEQIESDNVRTKFLQECGVKELRFTNEQVNNQLVEIFKKIIVEMES